MLLRNTKVVVVLGRIAMETYLTDARNAAESAFPFGHNVLYPDVQPMLLCSYHPSQQNTSTGKLTQAMLDDVFLRARDLVINP